MAPRAEKSQLKRERPSTGENDQDAKKPRRSERIQSQSHNTPLDNKSHLPSPLTRAESSTTEHYKEATVTPPEGRPSQIRHRTPISSPPPQGLYSPPSDTQPLSQFIYPSEALSDEVEDEEAEGVWGYLLPLDSKFGATLVLKRRTACPVPSFNGFGRGTARVGAGTSEGNKFEKEEEAFERSKEKGIPAGGYLIGRHAECDRVLDLPTISNRHCLLFSENKDGDTVAVIEDLSSNGTFVNEAIVGRNNRRELEEADEITILDEARFVFRYPKSRDTSGFRQQYKIQDVLGKGHFATVYLCIEKASGQRYAVKRFEKRPGQGERSKSDGLQQEIAVLMGVSHPNMLCLKDTFDETDGVYLVLELAPEGELFNWIVMKQKLTEEETRKIFIQLFQGMAYLVSFATLALRSGMLTMAQHARNIVHRDIKPENILLVDKELTVKVADFGLAKIIGEESFTTTLCGTPSYVAPEILENTKQRKYTRAVDVWSLGVVLYICLCGFPPFSDELYTPENPYTLSQQIKLGRFDYPSPYWDSVGDQALDLIDKMLTVNVDDRLTIDECLEHPWITLKGPDVKDSTDSLTGAMDQLDFSKRKVQRERTMLSAINDVKVERVINIQAPRNPVKVFEKNPVGKKETSPLVDNGVQRANGNGRKKENSPAANRHPDEFMEMGGKGDQPLFAEESGSRYAPNEVPKADTKDRQKK
ncbi:MAG: hypothetical protein M1836_007254 [Candelina mexicana]|nr:MAG: hypothetical protein M1836_007254 [Candelina mexicana]